MDDIFPKIKKSIKTLIEDEEGNIPGNKLLTLGSLVIILGALFPLQVFAGHRSHSSHKSHSSHSSHSSSHSSGHSSHSSHSSHKSHSSHESGSSHSSHSSHANTHSSHSDHGSHISHTSHANTSSHSNSRYTKEGDVTYAPEASSIDGVSVKPARITEDSLHLTDVNQNILFPNSTPEAGFIPTMSVPLMSTATKIDADELTVPPKTDQIEW